MVRKYKNTYNIFEILQIFSLIPKDQKKNIISTMDDVRGDFLGPPHGTTPAAVIANKNNCQTRWKQENINNHKIKHKIILFRSMLLANVSNGITGTKAMCHNNVLGLKYLWFECFSFIIDILLMFHEYALD